MVQLIIISPLLYLVFKTQLSEAGGIADNLSIFDLIACFALLYQLCPRPSSGRKSFKFTKADKYVLLFILAASLSMVPLIYSDESLQPSLKAIIRLIEYVVLYFAVSNNLHSWLDIKRAFSFVAICGFVVSIIGILQFMIGPFRSIELFPWGPTWTTNYTAQGFRVYSLFDNPIFLGTYLVITISFTLGLVIAESNKNRRVFYVCALVISGSCALLTFSRTALMGLVVVVLGFMLLRARWGIPVMLGFLVVAAYVIPHELQARVFIEDKESLRTIYARFDLYQDAVQIYSSSPFLGVGIGNYGSAYAKRFAPTAREDSLVFTAENTFLHYAAEMGTVGLVAFVSVCFYFLWQLNCIRKNLTRADSWLSGCYITLLAYYVCSLFSTMTSVGLNATFWILLGLFKAVIFMESKTGQTFYRMASTQVDVSYVHG